MKVDSDVNVKVNESTTLNSVWSPYALTDSDLLKLLFIVNNPGILLSIPLDNMKMN